MHLAAVACFLVLAAASAPLDEAETAFAAGRYADVVPLLEKALAGELSAAQKVRARALQAHVYASFDRTNEAVEAYLAALRIDPTFTPGERLSPKVRGLYEEARRLHRLERPPPPEAVSGLQQPLSTAASKGLLQRPAFWVVVAAAVVAGTATAIGVSRANELPHGNVPNGVLR